ncbi:LysE family translocator [Clostridium sp. JNZ X4-2]
MLTNLFRGVLIGLITGMPLGPIGAMCLRNTLSFGRKYGLASGLGSAVTDSIYASLAVLGFIIIEKFIVVHELYFRTIGGLILIFFGIYPFISKKQIKTLNKSTDKINMESVSPNDNLLFKAFASTFLMALANPATIFSFMAVFTGLHLSNVKTSPTNKSFLILGVFTGSMIWWFLLVSTAGKFNSKLNVKNTKFINNILNTAIIFGGVLVFLSSFNSFNIRKPPFLHSKLFKIFFNIRSKIPFHK